MNPYLTDEETEASKGNTAGRLLEWEGSNSCLSGPDSKALNHLESLSVTLGDSFGVLFSVKGTMLQPCHF